jgi:hypothetical protein
MSLNLEAVEGKSHHPECFGFILHLWSLLLRLQEHNRSAHWCGCLGGWGCVCVWGGGGSLCLGCVSGGVATVISLGIRSSLGFRFRIRFRVGIHCCTPDTHPGCCGPDVSALARSPPLARAPTHWCVDPGGRRGVMFLFWLVRSLGVRIFGLHCLGVRNFGFTVFWLAACRLAACRLAACLLVACRLAACQLAACRLAACCLAGCMSTGCMSPTCMSPSCMWISGSLCGCLLRVVWFFGFFLGRMARW